MKGLMKNIRYIFHMFEEDEEEETEMQIGLPTDVKHVAHIGWDGPSVNAPSWMDEFKSQPGENESSTNEVDSCTQESKPKKGGKDRNLPALPKSSRRQQSVDSIGSIDSPTDSPTQKGKSSKKRSKKKDSKNRESETSNSQDLPNIPKKGRKKKSSKDNNNNNDSSVKSTSSSRSIDKGSKHGSRYESDNDGSVSNKYDD